jgi:hypothetical protein
MATTTPNYGWDVPTSTDYVKDGATAIETLGDDIDASLFSITGGKNVGYQHLVTSTFSAQTQVIIDNVFSASYDNYAFIFDGNASTRADMQYQLRVGGANDSTAVYQRQLINVSNNTFTGVRVTNQGASNIGYIGGSLCFVEGNISQPFASGAATSSLFKSNLILGTGIEYGGEAGGYNANKSFTGIRVFMATGTFTGNIRIYGLRNS